MHKKSFLAVATVALFSASAYALDIGFESALTVIDTDNYGGLNTGPGNLTVPGGLTTELSLGVFGEHTARNYTGGFDANILLRQRSSDDDVSEDNTITRFLGALDYSITPRGINWYFGDVLGTVLPRGQLQALDIDNDDLIRRNVFITGPEFNFELDEASRIRARLLYVNQSDDRDIELDTVYSLSASYESELSSADRWGWLLSDIFTQTPEVSIATQVQESDYNRLSAALFYARARSVNEYYFQAGLTRYSVDDDTVDGAGIQGVFTRALSPQSSVSFSAGQDLSDATLSSIESLSAEGVATVDNVDAVVLETNVSIDYRFDSAFMALDASLGYRDSDYQLLFSEDRDLTNPDTEDTTGFFGSVALFRRISRSLTGNAELSFIHEEAVNTGLEQDSLLATLSLSYELSTSWSIEGGVSHGLDEGIENTLIGTAFAETPFETEENRVFMTLRWAPPTRATKDSVLELKSLISSPG